jgi:hypothetical protein
MLCLLLVERRMKRKEKKKKKKRNSQRLFSQGRSWTCLAGCAR